MKHIARMFSPFALAAAVAAPQAQAQTGSAAQPSRPSGPVQQEFAPGLARYTDEVLFGDVWVRPELSPRDRSLAVISALIATNRPVQLTGHLNRALNNGVTPVEASGALAHLAIYAGWPSAVSALAVYEQVYTERKIDTAILRQVGVLTPQADVAAEAAEAAAVDAQFGAVAPKFAQLTNEVVFGDLWRRSDLKPRDRSLVTIAALAVMGDDDQLDTQLQRGVENGLSRDQIAEALTHLGFYAGWPKATKALAVLARVLGTQAPANASAPAGSENFTGVVSVTRFASSGGATLGGGTVSFEPDARTKWHSHPVGQLLVVLSGAGWMQIEGSAPRALAPGEVVWTPPNVKHWHGATRTSPMTHVAVSESREGLDVTWLEPVTEDQVPHSG